MENAVALVITGFIVTRVAAVGLLAFLVYRILRSEPGPEWIPVRSQGIRPPGDYARERAEATRHQR